MAPKQLDVRRRYGRILYQTLEFVGQFSHFVSCRSGVPCKGDFSKLTFEQALDGFYIQHLGQPVEQVELERLAFGVPQGVQHSAAFLGGSYHHTHGRFVFRKSIVVAVMLVEGIDKGTDQRHVILQPAVHALGKIRVFIVLLPLISVLICSFRHRGYLCQMFQNQAIEQSFG